MSMNMPFQKIQKIFHKPFRVGGPALSRGFVVPGLLLGLAFSAGGCRTDVVHQRSLSELNQKAQSLIQAGDYAGAIARLESARDLQPDEPGTTYNLAIAYQATGRYDQAIGLFSQLLEKPDNVGASGLSPAEVRKAMGITWEAKADKLTADAKSLEGEPPGKAPKAGRSQTTEALSREAEQAYRAALDNYREALAGELKDAADVRRQMAALEARLAKKSDAVASP
jgi:tetratricopeptide (TPR) repeat protein